jgi:hypothetical protein
VGHLLLVEIFAFWDKFEPAQKTQAGPEAATLKPRPQAGRQLAILCDGLNKIGSDFLVNLRPTVFWIDTGGGAAHAPLRTQRRKALQPNRAKPPEKGRTTKRKNFNKVTC